MCYGILGNMTGRCQVWSVRSFGIIGGLPNFFFKFFKKLGESLLFFKSQMCLCTMHHERVSAVQFQALFVMRKFC